jgi:hypothetical protein
MSDLLNQILQTLIALGLGFVGCHLIYWSVVERKNVKPNPHKPWKR